MEEAIDRARYSISRLIIYFGSSDGLISSVYLTLTNHQGSPAARLAALRRHFIEGSENGGNDDIIELPVDATACTSVGCCRLIQTLCVDNEAFCIFRALLQLRCLALDGLALGRPATGG
jgi:hypothetical protein